MISTSKFTTIKKERLEKRINVLTAQYEAVCDKRETNLNPGDDIPLENKLQQLEKNIRKEENELENLLHDERCMESNKVYTEAPEPNYQNLARRLQLGDFVLFLGTELSTVWEENLPNVNKIASQFANDVGYHDFTGSLPEIAEYIQIHCDFQRTILCDKIKKSWINPSNSNSIQLYQLLAKINKRLLLISATYDTTLLEQAFQQNNHPFVVICYSTENIGQFFLKYSDKKKIEHCNGEVLSSYLLLENGYTVIFKILGCFDINSSISQESLIASESDFFKFIQYQNRFIPNYIKKCLKKLSFLLLGYYPTSWEKRLILNEMLEDAKGRPLSVLHGVDKFASVYLENHNFHNYQIDLKQFITNLQEHF
jgi:hypothetical protein